MTEQLHLPAGMNYSCTQCGKSCAMFHEVVLDPDSLRRVEEIDWLALMPEELRDVVPWKPSPLDEKRTILSKKPCGECVFQQPDRLCGIHAQHGIGHKPQACQDFPYRFVETPGGVYVGLSFACSAVLENTGRPVEEQRAELAEHFPRATSRRDTHANVRLTARHEISWDAYLAIEEDLRAILRHEDSSVGERLVAQGVYLDMVVPLLRQARGDAIEQAAPRTPAEAGGSESFPPDSGQSKDLDVVRAVHDRFCSRLEMKELFRLVRRPRPSAALQRAFIGLMTAFRQNLYIKGKKPTRAGTMAGILHHYAAHMMKLGRVNLEALDEKFPYAAFARYGEEWEKGEEERALLLRFFDHCLVRKDLLLGDNVWTAHRLMLMHYALIRWHAVGLADLQDKDRITLEVLRQSIRDVERHYIYHTDFGKLFEKFPMLAMVLDGVARRPTYGVSMIARPG
jgi:Fe-S-cluster containining protein